MTYLLNKRGEKAKEFTIRTFEIEEGIINMIRKSQKEFIDKYSEGNVEEKDQNAIKEIYERKNFKALTGKEALDFCERLQQ